jgi:hypothetical protein
MTLERFGRLTRNSVLTAHVMVVQRPISTGVNPVGEFVRRGSPLLPEHDEAEQIADFVVAEFVEHAVGHEGLAGVL